MAMRLRRWREWRRYERARQDHWGGTGRIGSRVAVCGARSRGRTLRDAAGAADAGAPNSGICRIGVLEFAEVYFRQYRTLAAEGRDAPGGIVAAGTGAGVFGSGGACVGGGSRQVFGASD